MPTVKLHSSGKVILKDGKVSCTCCEPEPDCCMYPADGLGDSYTEDDLPDAVELTYDFAEGTIMTRDGAQYTEDEFGIYRINRVADGTDDCGESGPKWRLQIKDGEGNWFTDNCTDCLIVPGFVEDQFADTYQMTFFGETRTLNRVGLCEWVFVGGDFDECTYAEMRAYYDPTTTKWTYFVEVNFGCSLKAALEDKDDPQSSPVGSATTASYGDIVVA